MLRPFHRLVALPGFDSGNQRIELYIKNIGDLPEVYLSARAVSALQPLRAGIVFR